MNLKSKFVPAILAAALSLGAAHAQQPIPIKFSHVVAENTPKGKGALKFKELAEQKTGGRVKVDVYPNSSLYKDREEMEALQIGSVHMLAPSVSKFGPLGVRQFEVFDLPYMFPDKATLYSVMDGPIGQGLLKMLEAKGIVGLAYWDNGFKQMSANKPLRSVESFSGLKMRIQSSKVLEGQMKQLGAIPQSMAFSEVYTALQQGVVDGTENPWSNMYTQKMHEVQKHATVSDHGLVAYAVIVNKKWWDGLPPDIHKALQAAMAEATKYERDIAQKENDDAFEKIKAAKTTEIYVLPAAERLVWQKAMLPLHQQYEGVVGKDTIQAIYKTAQDVAKARK
ncbi:MAG: TRAP transporter substrate-binding protein [Betaproteobacteria bacterium]|nr:TRAP transporter substrate-binding protein [Betaproteobacteria bacterium]